MPSQQGRFTVDAVARQVTAAQMARMFRRRERRAAMQDALIIEHHEIAAAQSKLELKCRVAQQQCELPIGAIERLRVVEREP